MQSLFNSKTASASTKNAVRAFSSGPKPNPFDKVKTSLGGYSFYKLPALGDARLSKDSLLAVASTALMSDLLLCLFSRFRLPPLLHQSPARVSRQEL